MYKYLLIFLFTFPVLNLAKGQNLAYADSVQSLTKKIEKYPNAAGYLYLRGYYKDLLSDYLGAILDFSEAIRILPSDPEFYISRSMVYYSLRDFESSLSDINKAIEIDRKHYYAYYLRGRVKVVLGLYQPSLLDYTACIDGYTKDPFRDSFILSIAYYERGLLKLNYLDDIDGCYDLSTAGQMGVDEAYTLIKEKCN